MATRKRPPPRKEHDEQVAFLAWFRRQFPRVLIHAIPNGGARHAVEARRLVAAGVVSGIPDLHVPEWDLWIEMKRVRLSVTSDAQKAMHKRLRAMGETVILAKGANEARRQVLEFLKKGGSDE